MTINTPDRPKEDYAVATFINCRGNPGPGRYKTVLKTSQTGVQKEIEGRDPSTTSNRMDLTAAIEGLNALPPGATVLMIVNSEYMMKGMTEWLPGWKAKGWRGSNKKPVKNVDLWRALDEAATRHERVRWGIGTRTWGPVE